MKRFSLKQSVVMVGAVAALALGTGIVPGAANSTPTAQAAELAQHGGGHGTFQHHDGGFRHEGRRDFREEFRGHRFWNREGFEHRYWGWGYHRFYPQYYVSYSYEPVSRARPTTSRRTRASGTASRASSPHSSSIPVRPPDCYRRPCCFVPTWGGPPGTTVRVAASRHLARL